MPEFWVSSGHHLTPRTEGGGLAVTDELILAYLARPELVPPDEACAAERALHASLMAQPRRAVSKHDIAALADADARENWTMMLAFRDRLLAAASVEAAYLDLARNGAGSTPPLFLNQLVHLILRNALDACEDPYVLRAAELFFRPQRVSFNDGAVLLADAETVEAHEQGRAQSPLVAMLGQEPAAELDVLDDANAWTYWSRSDAFTMALNLGSNPRSREGLARVIETWVRHLLGIEVAVEPIAKIEDRDWRWFVGLDAEATRIGNALWQGRILGDDAQSRILALFRLAFPDASFVDPRMVGFPVYLILAMTPDKMLRMKPQNLLVGLPLAAARAA
jgi:hypothetical protein